MSFLASGISGVIYIYYFQVLRQIRNQFVCSKNSKQPFLLKYQTSQGEICVPPDFRSEIDGSFLSVEINKHPEISEKGPL